MPLQNFAAPVRLTCDYRPLFIHQVRFMGSYNMPAGRTLSWLSGHAADRWDGDGVCHDKVLPDGILYEPINRT